MLILTKQINRNKRRTKKKKDIRKSIKENELKSKAKLKIKIHRKKENKKYSIKTIFFLIYIIKYIILKYFIIYISAKKNYIQLYESIIRLTIKGPGYSLIFNTKIPQKPNKIIINDNITMENSVN